MVALRGVAHAGRKKARISGLLKYSILVCLAAIRDRAGFCFLHRHAHELVVNKLLSDAI
jgi:hypothetical protein